MEIQDTNIFTGYPEIDTQILHGLDRRSLYQICQVNKYAYGLCINDIGLKRKINDFFNFRRLPRGNLRIGSMEHDVFRSSGRLPPGPEGPYRI